MFFDRFRQADSSSTRRAGGLGLGLAIVQHIVDLHGGKTCAYSEGLGKGAAFVVELPLLAQPLPLPKPEQPNRSNADWPSLAGLRILAVDDEPDTRDMLATLLEMQGAQIQVVSSAASALQAITSFNPDIVISDIGMPIVDGYELGRQLKALHPDLPMVALTAYAAPDDVRKAKEAGYAEHLSKPVDAAKLLDIVARLGRKTRG